MSSQRKIDILRRICRYYQKNKKIYFWLRWSEKLQVILFENIPRNINVWNWYYLRRVRNIQLYKMNNSLKSLEITNANQVITPKKFVQDEFKLGKVKRWNHFSTSILVVNYQFVAWNKISDWLNPRVRDSMNSECW